MQLNDQLKKGMENARSALMAIFTTFRFLCRQGLSIRGHEDPGSSPGLKERMGRSSYKWLSHDIQNEIIDILGKSVLHSVVCEMKKREHFAIMVDETCDISIHDQNKNYDTLFTFWKKNVGAISSSGCLEEKPTHVEEPQLPRRRRIPKRFQNPCATEPHIFFTPKDYFRQEFNCTELQKLVSVEKEYVSAVIAVNDTTPKLEKTREFFRSDLDTDRLLLHLTMLGDIAIRKRVTITSIRDIQEFLKEDSTVRDILPEVNKCIKLLSTVPVTKATAERSFSALRHLKTCLRSTMVHKRLNNIALLNAHQAVLHNLDLRPLVNEFIKSNTVRRITFALF
ncbi:hypothetical protein PR048_023407 [Dryococelus australis]|uniref:HAT C-terminal dimerisation domain-containing protein n=1 Tax=Dryococelus australis TaxID=614101 RepID=A0ABQ9GU12_9NEOP|nr:hypothetical protein PR048_023407 [Dryococelus australis]